jgi:two-component system sensor histidine kinase BaeS
MANSESRITNHVTRISLFTKLSAASVLVAVVAVAVVALMSRQSARREFTRFMLQNQAIVTDDLLAQLSAHYARQGSWTDVEQVLEQSSIETEGQRIIRPLLLIDTQGRIVASNWTQQIGEPLLEHELTQGWPVQVNGKTVGTLVVPGSRRPPPERMPEWLGPEGAATLDRVQQAILTAGVVAGALALVMAGVLAWGLVRPLHRLTRATEAIAQGDLSQRVPVTSGDEVGELAAAFNFMADELQRAEQLRRDMTADVAHELRNPLSVIRSHVEALQDGVFDLTPGNLEPIHDKTMLLSRLVEDLRELALAEAGQLPLERAPTDLIRLVEQTLEGFQAQAEKKEIDLRVNLPPELPLVSADRGRIGQVLTNLLSNALRHTPPGGMVTVSATTADSCVHLSVADTGQGIAPADLPNVFERFYRGDQARERPADSQGTGLGLAIARQLVEMHGGTIGVESAPGAGSEFWFTLPAV